MTRPEVPPSVPPSVKDRDLSEMIQKAALQDNIAMAESLGRTTEVTSGRCNLFAFSFGVVTFVIMVAGLTFCWSDVVKLAYIDKTVSA